MKSLRELFKEHKPFDVLETLNIERLFSKYQNPLELETLVLQIIHDKRFSIETEYLNGTICWYSGGLESAIIASKLYSKNNHVRFINALNVEKAKENFGHHLVEPFLILTAFMLGAKEVVLGLEYGPEDNNIGNNQEFGEVWLNKISEELNITILQPLVMTSKYELFRNAMAENIPFISCSENPQDSIDNELHWCGSCFKCFQIETFYRIYNMQKYRIWRENSPYIDYSNSTEQIIQAKRKISPIKVKPSMTVKRYISELKDYFNNGVRNMENGNSNDPFTDNWTMIDSLLTVDMRNPIETLSLLWLEELKG